MDPSATTPECSRTATVTPSHVVALNIADDQVQTIHAVANPEKLQHLDRPTR
jgi:hypothetical protein